MPQFILPDDMNYLYELPQMYQSVHLKQDDRIDIIDNMNQSIDTSNQSSSISTSTSDLNNVKIIVGIKMLLI